MQANRILDDKALIKQYEKEMSDLRAQLAAQKKSGKARVRFAVSRSICKCDVPRSRHSLTRSPFLASLATKPDNCPESSQAPHPVPDS